MTRILTRNRVSTEPRTVHLDHEWLYDPAMDGIDQDPAVAHLGIVPMNVKGWFTPFNQTRTVHPHVAEA